jgi:hypothetical protein
LTTTKTKEAVSHGSLFGRSIIVRPERLNAFCRIAGSVRLSVLAILLADEPPDVTFGSTVILPSLIDSLSLAVF